MHVVAAGVGDRHGVAHIGPRGGRGEGQARRLLHRQGVHVGAQGHDPAGAAAAQYAHHARLADPGANLQPQGAQVIGHHARRARLVEAQFGMLMQIAAPGGDARQDALDRRIHGLGRDGRRGLCVNGPGGQHQRQGGNGEQTAHVTIP